MDGQKAERNVFQTPTNIKKPVGMGAPSTSELFDRIIEDKTAFFKSQQRNEPDLTEPEKRLILSDLLDKQPSTFLSRYAANLRIEDKQLFVTRPGGCNREDIEFYFGKIKKLSEPSQSCPSGADNVGEISPQEPAEKEDAESQSFTARGDLRRKRRRTLNVMTKNRRYVAMRKMLKEGDDFFSDWDMRQRCPLLYDQMIGRYLDDKEKETLLHSGAHDSSTLSKMFLDFYETQLVADRLNEQIAVEQSPESSSASEHSSIAEDQDQDMGDSDQELSEDEQFQEEFDSDDETKLKSAKLQRSEKPRRPSASVTSSVRLPAAKAGRKIGLVEKAQLREEFMALMQQRFLAGEDGEFFDYTTVDNNTEYDALDLIDRDAQDAYFDSEEPS